MAQTQTSRRPCCSKKVSKAPSNGSENTILPLNDWNEVEVKHAENAWGNKLPQYTLDMFDFLIANSKSYLDLGCGFGRFLAYLLEKVDEPDYIGYDSSDSMTLRAQERFPELNYRIFLRDITAKITHPQDAILVSAVFIHLPIECQQVILENLKNLHPKPSKITFDINSPNEFTINRMKEVSYERQIKTTRLGTSKFRMTWQKHDTMTSYLLREFKDYTITVKFYDLSGNQHKVVYFLERE